MPATELPTSLDRNFNPLKGRYINWLHVAIQVYLYFQFLAFAHSGARVPECQRSKNTLKCNHLIPLHFKRLNTTLWNATYVNLVWACKSWQDNLMEQHNKCWKCLLLALTNAIKWSHHWSTASSMTSCSIPHRVSITCCISSSTSLIGFW